MCYVIDKNRTQVGYALFVIQKYMKKLSFMEVVFSYRDQMAAVCKLLSFASVILYCLVLLLVEK